MTVTDIGNEIFLELGEPSDVSLASIVQKLRFTVGELNNLINQGYTINSSYEIIDSSGVAIDTDAASILKKLYEIYYFRKQAKSFLGVNGIDSVSQVTQDGIIFRGIERNGIAKTYNELLKESKNDLKTLINNYKFNRAIGQQVEGDDKYSKYDIVTE